MWRMCNKVWRGEGWPEDWKLGIMVLELKKGEGNRVEDYRGIALTDGIQDICSDIGGKGKERDRRKRNASAESNRFQGENGGYRQYLRIELSDK